MGSLPEGGRSVAATPDKAPYFVRSAYPAFFVVRSFKGCRSSEQMERDHDFTQGEIVPQLVGFALPVLLALFLQTMYGAVDLMVVGRFGGELANVYVSAVSTGSQIMQTVTVVITGLAMGLTVYVARIIGAGQRERAGRIIGGGIWLFGVLTIILTGGMRALTPISDSISITYSPVLRAGIPTVS